MGLINVTRLHTYRSCTCSSQPVTPSLPGSGGGVLPIVLYREAPPIRGAFFGPALYERVRKIAVLINE